MLAGRPDEAIATARTLQRLYPGRRFAQSLVGLALLHMGQKEAALQAIQQEPAEDSRLLSLVMAYHALDRTAESDAALTELIRKYEQEWPYYIATGLAYRGEVDRTFSWLNKAVQHKDTDLATIASGSWFTNLHDDPRWLPFLESIGKSPEQLAAIEFKVKLPE